MDGTTRLLAVDHSSESHTCASSSLASGVVWWVVIEEETFMHVDLYGTLPRLLYGLEYATAT